MSKCSNCKTRDASGGRFDTLSQMDIPYKTCAPCRESRKKSMAKTIAAKKLDVPSDQAYCDACSTVKLTSEFGQRFYVGRGVSVPYKQCFDCRKARKVRYLANGAKQRDIQARPKKRARQAELAQVPLRKQHRKECQAVYSKTSSGQEARRRGWDVRRRKVMASPGLRLQESITASIRERLRGVRLNEESVNLASYSEFVSIDDMLAHFDQHCKPGMTMENYGTVWSVAHKIPQAYYDFDDLEEVRRCNSKANLGCDYEQEDNPEGVLTNKQKSDRIPSDAELDAIGRQHWPKAFGDGLSAQRRVELRSVLHARK